MGLHIVWLGFCSNAIHVMHAVFPPFGKQQAMCRDKLCFR